MRSRDAVLMSLICSCLMMQLGCSETPPVRVYSPAVSASSFDGAPSLPSNGYSIIDRSATVGRFPVTLGVLRLAHDGSLEPVKILPPEAAEWVEVFRGISAVRDLTFLAPVTLRAFEPTVAGRCTAARGVGAGLLLVYAPLRTGVNSAQVAGVIYDTKTQAIIATLQQTRSITNTGGVEASPEEVFEEREELADETDDPDPPDFRQADALFPTRWAFQESVRTAMLELADQDTPAPREPSNQWSQPAPRMDLSTGSPESLDQLSNFEIGAEVSGWSRSVQTVSDTEQVD
jgi:hypothetical protein